MELELPSGQTIPAAVTGLNVLAFDTCFSACSVAISAGRGRAGPRVEAEHRDMETGHAEALIPMIGRVAALAGVSLSQIDRIIVTNGPGTFTGIRTGVAAARALALSTGAKIIAVSSLWGIAAGAVSGGALAAGDTLIVAMDARKGQIYAQAFDAAGGELSEPNLLDADQAAALLPGRHFTVAGTSASSLAAVALAMGRSVTVAAPATYSVAPDAKHLLGAADRSSIAGPLLPHYLRPPDAKPQADKSLPWSSK